MGSPMGEAPTDGAVGDGAAADGPVDGGLDERLAVELLEVAPRRPIADESAAVLVETAPRDPIADESAAPVGAPPAAEEPARAEVTANSFAELPARERAQLRRVALRAAGPLGRRARVEVSERWVYPHGFPAIDRSGRVVALVDRITEICGEGVISFVDARSGVHLDSLPLPVHGGSDTEDSSEEDCQLDVRAARRLERRLARDGFRQLPSLRSVGAGGAPWFAGNGFAVRIDEHRAEDEEEPFVDGYTVSAYDVRTGDLLETQHVDSELSLRAIPGGVRVVLEREFCACSCGLTSESWPPPPPPADPAASL
jgi:hypothetical protein